MFSLQNFVDFRRNPARALPSGPEWAQCSFVRPSQKSGAPWKWPQERHPTAWGKIKGAVGSRISPHSQRETFPFLGGTTTLQTEGSLNPESPSVCWRAFPSSPRCSGAFQLLPLPRIFRSPFFPSGSTASGGTLPPQTGAAGSRHRLRIVMETPQELPGPGPKLHFQSHRSLLASPCAV